MQISGEEKRKRARLAYELEEIFHYLFVFVRAEMVAYGDVDIDYYSDWIFGRYMAIASGYMSPSETFKANTKSKLKEIVRSTAENGAKGDLLGEPYALSDERAVNIAENEANFIRNDAEMEEAIANGFTMKTWLTMRDSRVRISHAILDGLTIPIDGYFDVGGSLMRYPMDMSMGADLSEIAGCRCSLAYS